MKILLKIYAMFWKNRKEKITEENWLELMKEKFPKFIPYWEAYINDHGSDNGITIQMFPVGDYAIDVIKSKDEIEIKRIFDFVELLLHEGDQSMQDAAATGLLEHLLNKDPVEIKFSTFVKHMGEEAIAYCKAWDKFTGVRTEGLWN
jgi:hypothetical protein